MDSQEFDVVIAQQLEELPQHYPELTNTWLDAVFGKQRKVVSAKLNKL